MENFDEKAITWDHEPRRVERAKVFAQEILRVIPDPGSRNGLEFGCGTGLLSFCLHPYLKQITLVDNSQGMMNVLAQKISEADITNMTPVFLDLSRQSYPGSDKFDIIYMLMSLHHIPDTDRVLEQFSQMLNPGGYLCIADLDEEDGSFHGEGFDGHNGFNQAALTGKLEKYGFHNTSWKICFQMSKQFEDGSEKTYPLFLMTGRKM